MRPRFADNKRTPLVFHRMKREWEQRFKAKLNRYVNWAYDIQTAGWERYSTGAFSVCLGYGRGRCTFVHETVGPFQDHLASETLRK